MNLGNPDLELIDPTPNIHVLFVQFDKTFFWAKLASRAVVRWSKRMYSCAGICSYEGRGGLCDIALSEPLLKLRPRKDLIETLLHEMIHAFLFVASRDQDRDGHGPNFQAHMHRINRSAGLNISIYHSFHDEVKLYQTHWWRCDGPCQTKRPHFGIVRRSANRAPGPNDYWWQDHKRKCGGNFIKIKEPQSKTKKTNKKVSKPNADITKYVNNNNVVMTNKNIPTKTEPNRISKVLNDNAIRNNIITINSITTVKPKSVSPTPKPSRNQTPTGRNRSNSASVLETVRNVWANKQISSTQTDKSPKHKHKSTTHLDSPPPKVKRIDDYFQKTATSLIKDVYGDGFKVTQSKDGSKLIAINVTKESEKESSNDLVDCPVCNAKVGKADINRHLDECLNKDLIEKLSNDSKVSIKIENDSKKTIENTNKLQTQNVDEIKMTNKIKTETIDDNIKKEKDTFLNYFDNDYSTILNETTSKLTKCQSVDTTINRPSTSTTNLPFKVREIPIKNELADITITDQKCACCGKKYFKPIEQHLDECLAFFDNTSVPEEGSSIDNTTIIIDDDDDEFDESMTLNATGTKTPCPCCMEMIEQNVMNEHLDVCLS